MTELTPERLAELRSGLGQSLQEMRELVDGYEDREVQRESVHKLASLLQESHRRAQRYAAALRQMSGWYEDVEIARRALEEKP